MSDLESTIISLDAAHKILSAFDIGPDNREYKRWRRDDGFRQVDLEDVLSNSPFVLNVDWRDSLEDVVETMTDQLRRLEIPSRADLNEEGNQGYFEAFGNRSNIKYVTDDDDFNKVIASINELIASKARYRQFGSSVGTDGWSYGLLPNDEWTWLKSNAPKVVELLFLPE